VETTVSQRREQLGLSPRGARDGDAPISLGLREVQGLSTVSEHRWESLAGVESALVGLPDVGDEIGLDASRLGDERRQAKEQLVVGHGLKGDSNYGFHQSNIGSASRASRKGTPKAQHARIAARDISGARDARGPATNATAGVWRAFVGVPRCAAESCQGLFWRRRSQECSSPERL
jgi:hypothetical protein